MLFIPEHTQLPQEQSTQFHRDPRLTLSYLLNPLEDRPILPEKPLTYFQVLPPFKTSYKSEASSSSSSSSSSSFFFHHASFGRPSASGGPEGTTTTTTTTLVDTISIKIEKGAKGPVSYDNTHTHTHTHHNYNNYNNTNNCATVWHVVEVGAPKPQKKRRRFDEGQLRILEEAFQESPFVAEGRKKALAFALQVSPKQVQHWFHNKRSRARSRNGAGLCKLSTKMK